MDRSKAVLLGVPVGDVYSALQAQFGSIVASQFTQYSRVWNVILQADAPYRQTPNDISKLYTKSTNGKMIPLSAVVSHRVHGRAGPRAAFQRFSRGAGHRRRRARLQLG